MDLGFPPPQAAPRPEPSTRGDGPRGGSSLWGTLSDARRPHPGLDRGLKDAAAPGAGPAGDGRRLPRGLGATVTGTALLVGPEAGAGTGSCSAATGTRPEPGKLLRGDGRTEPGAPRGRCGPKRGQKREGLWDRTQASVPRAARTHPHPNPGGVQHWAGTRTRPTRGRRYGGGSLAVSPENFLGFLIAGEKAPPS